MQRAPVKGSYQSRRPKETVLYQTVAQYWPEFCKELVQHDKHLPAFVEKEFEAYLKCGLLEYGYGVASPWAARAHSRMCLRRVWHGAQGGVQLQAPGILSVVRRAAHAKYGHASGGFR